MAQDKKLGEQANRMGQDAQEQASRMSQQAQEQARRMGQQAQEQTRRMGEQAQERMQSGVEAAGASFTQANRGFQALAAEVMNYSKTAFEDAMRTWEQLLSVKSLEQAMQIQSEYAKRLYDNHMAELSKLGEMCVDVAGDMANPVEQASKRAR
jgi:hypothetical protein